MDSMIVLVCGLPGSGKTRFATQLAGRIGATYTGSDAVRRTFADPDDYSPENKQRVYDELLRLTRETLEKDQDIVLDATFYQQSMREPFLRLASDSCRVFLIELRADEPLIQARLENPRPDSDADFAVYQEVKTQWQPPDENHLVLWSNNENSAQLLEDAMRYLHLVYDR